MARRVAFRLASSPLRPPFGGLNSWRRFVLLWPHQQERSHRLALFFRNVDQGPVICHTRVLPFMPQPFKRKPNQKVQIAPSAVLHRPTLAVMIANVASHWSKLEQSLSISFATILSGQEPSALANYNAIFDVSLRHTQFLTTARAKGLPHHLIEESEKLHARARKTATRRNKIVHGLWAICPDRPNSLLLCPPDAINNHIDQIMRDIHSFVDKSFSIVTISRNFDLMPNEYEEYTASDFIDVQMAITDLIAAADEYWKKVLNFSFEHERARRAPPR